MREGPTRISLTLNPGYELPAIPAALPPMHSCNSLPGPGHCIRIVFATGRAFRAMHFRRVAGTVRTSARLLFRCYLQAAACGATQRRSLERGARTDGGRRPDHGGEPLFRVRDARSAGRLRGLPWTCGLRPHRSRRGCSQGRHAAAPDRAPDLRASEGRYAADAGPPELRYRPPRQGTRLGGRRRQGLARLQRGGVDRQAHGLRPESAQAVAAIAAGPSAAMRAATT